MFRKFIILVGTVAALGTAGAALATPQLGDDCKACHANNRFLPPAHPNIDAMSSATCKTCHVATMSQDQSRDTQQTQEREQDREQVQDQDRDQQRDQDRRQIRLGGDPGANPLGTHSAARVANPGQEIERYLEQEREGAHSAETGSGGDAGQSEDHDFSHEFNHGDTRLAEKADKWTYRLVFGALHSSDIDQHQSASGMGGGGGHDGGGHEGGGHEGGGHEDDGDWGDGGDGDGNGNGSGKGAGGGGGTVTDGGFFRLGARAQYTQALGDTQTLAYSFALNRDQFWGIEQTRHVWRAGLDWKGRLDDGSWKIAPYLQRSTYDIEQAPDKAFWALGLNANRTLITSPTGSLSFTFRYKQRRYDGEPQPRAGDFRIGAVYQDRLGEEGRYRLGLGLSDRNNPQKDENRYFGQVLTAAIGGDPGNGALGWLDMELGHRRYKAPDAALGYTRDDRFFGVGASYSDPRMTLFSAVPQFACHLRWTQSNMAAYDGRSSRCSVLFEVRF
ncbi:surface lipoprotein assembly modifier [Tropicibacter oceani]|uniref:Surface lipoprotein assembly modifier n=1 Tax=Tropicibacter oceani TaxID=3058420 RepID=A0ABY8QCR4_9RHOB|nr:surface lipoprotein assembly modifier [Tropicibacter oceani]WGW02407.1 surface lipoprotein assembly modifier [Tropicibacter oceani]